MCLKKGQFIIYHQEITLFLFMPSIFTKNILRIYYSNPHVSYTSDLITGLSTEVAELMRRVRTVVGARARLAGVGGSGGAGE